MSLKAINFKNNALSIIDQTLLPNTNTLVDLDTFDKTIEAIKSLRVRGAPAIGIVAAYGVFIECLKIEKSGNFNSKSFEKICSKIKDSRPTAVNLSWAVDKMRDVYYSKIKSDKSVLLDYLKDCAVNIHLDDARKCDAIGKHGSVLLKDLNNVITHCNAGLFATGGNGTALSVIYTAHKFNQDLHVFVDETRPLGQGVRLTYYELKKNNVNCTLLPDNAAGSLFSKKSIDAVIVGADRITLNGDFANKIGTYPLAVLAEAHRVPFYVAAPTSTFDAELEEGAAIPIEMRSANEVLFLWNINNTEEYKVYNPAFDVTPAKYVTAFITETGIIKKPFKSKINKLINSKEI